MDYVITDLAQMYTGAQHLLLYTFQMNNGYYIYAVATEGEGIDCNSTSLLEYPDANYFTQPYTLFTSDTPTINIAIPMDCESPEKTIEKFFAYRLLY